MTIRSGHFEKRKVEDDPQARCFVPGPPLLCDGCQSEDIFAARAGTRGSYVHIGKRWVPVRLPVAAAAWCGVCWPWRQAAI